MQVFLRASGLYKDLTLDHKQMQVFLGASGLYKDLTLDHKH